MAAVLGAFAEIRINAGEKPRGAFNRFQREVMGLPGCRLSGYEVGAVIRDGLWREIEQPCIVPDFGHGVGCKCEHPEPEGVLRLFGLTIVVEGRPTADDVFHTYELAAGMHLIVCSLSGPPSRQLAVSLPVVERQGWDFAAEEE